MGYLKVFKKNKSYSLTHDGEYLGFIYKRDFETLGIAFTDSDEFYIDDISPEYVEDIKALVVKRVFDKAVGYAAVSESTGSVIRSKLRLKKYPEYAIDAAIDLMYSYNYLNDDRYIESYVRCYISGKSRYLIEKELQSKGLDISDKGHIIDAVYEDMGMNDGEVISALVERKFRGQDLEDEKVKRRVISFLIRHGFSFDKINNYLT